MREAQGLNWVDLLLKDFHNSFLALYNNKFLETDKRNIFVFE
jgi:hypothetical protein